MMKTILEQMVEEYQPKNDEEKKNAIKEVMQEIVLYGLSKADFFKVSAFYGGTALANFLWIGSVFRSFRFRVIGEG